MNVSSLNKIAEIAKIEHFRARNLLMLEAVISAFLDADDHRAVAQMLREHADQLEEFM